MREDVIATLKKLLITDLFVDVPEDQIGPDDGLQSVIGLDSVGFIELRVLCENRFNINITDADFTPDNFRSINRLANLVNQLQAKVS